MAKTRMTLGLCALGGLAAAASFSHTLDEALCWLIGGSAGAALGGCLVVTVAGEVQVWWECHRPDPKPPMVKPMYWPQAQEEDVPRWSMDIEPVDD